MAGHADEYERTMAFAEIALSQIKALHQPASPRNYEIWYAYATQELEEIHATFLTGRAQCSRSKAGKLAASVFK